MILMFLYSLGQEMGRKDIHFLVCHITLSVGAEQRFGSPQYLPLSGTMLSSLLSETWSVHS